MKPYTAVLIGLIACKLVAPCQAAEPAGEHTYEAGVGEARPSATLADASWLVGNWVGSGFGQQVEEVWNPPSAGSMVGMFKLFDGDRVSLYELMLLDEEAGSLVLKVKHFGADFAAWEEKTEYTRFPLARVDRDAIHFDGLSFYRDDPDHLRVYVRVRHDDDVREEELLYTRRKSQQPADRPALVQPPP